uniref:cellulase n=1 Tax=Mycena chlorophos TaxID=658473 RepID=A0ABQ0ME34_MYCCL|nr:glycoside hydrolase family 5 protein [Mycena chlorophos]
MRLSTAPSRRRRVNHETLRQRQSGHPRVPGLRITWTAGKHTRLEAKMLFAATAAVALALGSGVQAQGQAYAQCGGIGWTGATTCVSGTVCTVQNAYYSQCLPCTGSACGATTSSSATSSTSSTSTSSAPITSNTPPSGTGTLRFAGVNIAGFDFGTDTTGTQNPTSAYPPLTQYYGLDGQGQMNHFVKDDGFNIFRLPVGWQFLLNSTTNSGADLNPGNFAEYDALVQACLGSGAETYCILDIHNYARWNGLIIGQGGPPNEDLANTWSQLASHYKSEQRIVFGVMNEPHDLNVTLWAETVQVAVTAIRNAGATSKMILLPGDNWTAASTIYSDGSGAALLNVKNPDGSTTNLIIDVHKYLDANNSGGGPDCNQNNIAIAWEPLAQWLRANGRQALNTETGGGDTPNCLEFMCQQVAYQAQNSDVFLGYVGWGAGNFYPDLTPGQYDLSETPLQNATTGAWTDCGIVAKCLAPVAGAQKGVARR